VVPVDLGLVDLQLLHLKGSSQVDPRRTLIKVKVILRQPWEVSGRETQSELWPENWTNKTRSRKNRRRIPRRRMNLLRRVTMKRRRKNRKRSRQKLIRV
jgi:hypothetical protein